MSAPEIAPLPARLHLQKLSVGTETVDGLERWIAYKIGQRLNEGLPGEHIHTTRMMPRRLDRLLADGSMYWVIKGVMQCRQRIVDLRPVRGEDGISRCDIVLDPEIVRTVPRARRPFQGWRYLGPDDAPPDIDAGNHGLAEMPDHMRRELAELGLL